jgi:TonB-dependent SusC/RagA subfamily outer membrane receptor
MIAFAYYLFKVIACSGTLVGYYQLALRNRIFHQWNRYYLLATLLLSIALPLIRIPVHLDQQQDLAPAVQILYLVSSGDQYMQAINSNSGLRMGWEEISFMAYLLVCLFFLAAMGQGIYRIRRMILKNPVSQYGDIRVVSTNAKGAPFSFLRYIFWHRQIRLDSSTGQQILKHEMAHIRERHSYDKLLIQAILAVYWINPFFWLIRKELGMIHEFTADQQSVEQGDTAAFAAMILQAAYPQHQLPLMNHFFHSPIQRRLHMLLKSQNKKVTYFSRILALPLLAVIGVAFTVKTQQARARKDFSGNAQHAFVEQNKSISSGTSLQNGSMEQNQPIVPESMSQKKDSGITVLKNAQITMTSASPWNVSGSDNPLIVVNGERKVFADLLNKTISAEVFTIYDKQNPVAMKKYGRDAKEGAMIFENAVLSDVKEIPDAGAVNLTGSVEVLGDTGHPIFRVETLDMSAQPLYVIDGMIINKNVERDALNLMVKPEDIEKIDVLKGEAAKTLYGDRGQNGVVMITTRKLSAEDRLSGITSTMPVELTGLEVTDNSPVFTSVDVPAVFPGGEDEMVTWIKKQLAAQPDVQRNPGQFKGLAGLRFIVNTLGQVTNVSLLNAKGKTYNSKLSMMVAALLQKGPYWQSAKQNGAKVRSFRDLEFRN